jgi:hypothetical protein
VRLKEDGMVAAKDQSNGAFNVSSDRGPFQTNGMEVGGKRAANGNWGKKVRL